MYIVHVHGVVPNKVGDIVGLLVSHSIVVSSSESYVRVTVGQVIIVHTDVSKPIEAW